MIYGQPVTFGGASGEIDITDNGTFDVKKYATANVNVAPVLLWTNASPSSAFAEQTLTFGGTYDGYIIEVRCITTQNAYAHCYVKNGVTVPIIAGKDNDFANAYYQHFGWRCVTATANTLTFTGGAYDDEPGTHKNNCGVPTRIWGVKFTL